MPIFFHRRKLVETSLEATGESASPLLIAIDGEQLVEGHAPLSVSLMLLPRVLYIISCHDDEQLQAIRSSGRDPGIVYVVLREPPGEYNAWVSYIKR